MKTLTGSVWPWILQDRAHQFTAAAAGLAVLLLGWYLAHGTRRRARSLAGRRRQRRAADAEGGAGPKGEPLDPFAAYVAVVTTALSVNGMWTVFSESLPLPVLARLVACTVLESAGLAFMRAARKRILAKKPAGRLVATVWLVVGLSGSLSAGASNSLFEVVLRLTMPPLSVLLLHSWMLPEHDEITLTRYEKGKQAWRFVRATRRVERAGNPVTKSVARALKNRENDRLTRKSLMTGDADSVLAAAERAATAEALKGLGLDPAPKNTHGTRTGNASENGAENTGGTVPGNTVRGASKNTDGTGVENTPAVPGNTEAPVFPENTGTDEADENGGLVSGRDLSEAELAELIRQAHPVAGPPVRQVMRSFNVGYDKARKALVLADAARPVTVANGSAA